MPRCCVTSDTFVAPLSSTNSTGITALLGLYNHTWKNTTILVSILPKSNKRVDKTKPRKISVWQVFVVFFCFFSPRKLDLLALFLSQTSLSDCVGGGKCEESREWAGLCPEAADLNSRWYRPAQSTLFHSFFLSLTHIHTHARTSKILLLIHVMVH